MKIRVTYTITLAEEFIQPGIVIGLLNHLTTLIRAVEGIEDATMEHAEDVLE